MRGSANTTERTDGRHGLAYDMAWGMEYGKGGYGKGHMKRMLFGQIRCSALQCNRRWSYSLVYGGDRVVFRATATLSER